MIMPVNKDTSLAPFDPLSLAVDTLTYKVKDVVEPLTDQIKAAQRTLQTMSSGALPLARKNLNLRSMVDFVGQTWLVEREAEGRYRIRIWSTGSLDLWGQDETGSLVEKGSALDNWVGLYERTLASAKPSVVHNLCMLEGERLFRSEVLLWPVRSEAGVLNQIFCPWVLLERWR